LINWKRDEFLLLLFCITGTVGCLSFCEKIILPRTPES
jgi:hypothetical protein